MARPGSGYVNFGKPVRPRTRARLGDRVSWTLTFLFIGLGIGCLIAWYWVKRESDHE